MSYLDRVEGPSDIKQMNVDELKGLAVEVRNAILEKLETFQFFPYCFGEEYGNHAGTKIVFLSACDDEVRFKIDDREYAFSKDKPSFYNRLPGISYDTHGYYYLAAHYHDKTDEWEKEYTSYTNDELVAKIREIYTDKARKNETYYLDELLFKRGDERAYSFLGDDYKAGRGAPQSEKLACEFYTLLQNLKDTQVFDLQQPGDVFRYDDMQVKVLGVANDFTGNPYNNSSMIYRVWDRRKSILFLGDAGVECGQKVLDGPFRSELDCEYIQMAHHGQNGCDENFYRSIKFRACLWPTPTWVWDNDQGKGFNTGILKTVEVRGWMDKLGIKEHHTTCLEGLWQLD